MNIIINDSNTTIGGIEVLFIEIANYLINKGHKVYFLVRDHSSIYQEKLYSQENIIFIMRNLRKPTELFSNSDIKSEKDYIYTQLPQNEEFIVISPYFQSLQYVMAVFGDSDRFKLMHLWSHPQNWANQVGLKKKNSFQTKRIQNHKYFYQQKLIETLAKLDADYYGARVVPVFNSWFYEIDLSPLNIETLPIEDVEESSKKIHSLKSQDRISVLWCGRFAYFKNEAIIHIHNTLEELAKKYPEKKFNYGIIGFGDGENTNYIKQNIKSNKVEVDFIGKVDTDRLIEIFHQYDVGIGMGLTVKKMGQVGLPAIVIDSFEPQIPHIKNCNWLIDSTEGDAGDGYYFKIAGKSIDYREKLIDLLDDVVHNPEMIEDYSQRCIQYVESYYSSQTQLDAILSIAINSKFAGRSYPIYRLTPFYRWILSGLYKLFNELRKL